MRRAAVVVGCAVLLVSALAPAGAHAAFLPLELAPPAPFPLVVAQSFTREFVAPGVERGTYRLQTSAGPLVVDVVRVDLREPTVRLDTVLARDRIVSGGETVSSMAARTGAVAGINADYFDIGNTNAPLGVLARDQTLLRTPSTRVAFEVTRERDVRFTPFTFSGRAIVNGATAIAVGALNEWPPHDGAAFLTPDFGVPRAQADTVIAELTPQPVPSLAGAAVPAPGGRYRVTQIDTGTAPAHAGFALALGPAAQSAVTTLPDVGDLIDVAFDTDPPLADVAQAVGGGPALLTAGAPVDDPASPGYADRARRIPVAAAARLADGDLVLAVVDGRHPAVSIGVNRSELIALLQSIGATDAMQFDSGGSATLVARVLGESRATVQNEPSDGVERPVADGLFVYSDAPPGPPARLVIRPSAVEALPDTAIPLHAAIVDAAGHPLGDAAGPWRVAGTGATIDDAGVLRTAATPTTTVLDVERGGVRAALPLRVVAAVARLTIDPDRPDPDPGATIALHARASDDDARPVAVDGHVVWSALRGQIAPDGTFTAGSADGFVTAAIGGVKASEIVRVGRHAAPLPGFAPDEQSRWRFSSIPAGGPGGVAFSPQGTLLLSYDFRADERAAYAGAGIVLGEPLAVSCAIEGDANGEGVRIALLDRYGERATVTLAKSVDWTGARRREARIPAALAPPLVLQSLYAIGSLGAAPVKSAGTVGIGACTTTLPGTAAPAP